MNDDRVTEFALKSSEAYEPVQLDKNKLDQGKYQAGVIQDFIPALTMAIAFGKATKYWDNSVPDYLQAFDEFQLGGMYNNINKSPFLYIHAMAFSLLCLLEEHRREILTEGQYVAVGYPFLLGSFKLALNEVAELGSMNNKPFGKYDRGSWRLVENAKERYLDAFWRHQLEDMFVIDETTGKIHLVAMLWNLLALISFEISHPEKDIMVIARNAHIALAKLGNGDIFGNSDGNLIAVKALEELAK